MAYKKYYLYKKQVSYDQVTWYDVTPAEYAPSGEPIGYYDTYEECIAQYRTIQSGYTCVGYDKHNQDVYEVSYDNGVTWSVVSTSAGTLIEANSPDCGYTPGFNGKYKLTLDDTSVVSAECTSSSALSEDFYQYEDSLVEVEIGNCVTGINESIFASFDKLTDVIIGNNVTSIGRYAFANSPHISSVTMGDNVVTIGYGAFSDCSFSNITLPNTLTTIGDKAFNSCHNLTGITIPHSVTTIGSEAFSSCESFRDEAIRIGSGVTTIGDNAFDFCTGLTEVFCYATAPPTLGSDVFNDCWSLDSIRVPEDSVNAYKSAPGWSDFANIIRALRPWDY